MTSSPTSEEVAGGVDRLLGGRLLLRQPMDGHRAGTDAVLLAAAAGIEPGDVVLDVGSGAGTVGLILALREPGASIRLLEREPALVACAQSNLDLNGLAGRVRVEARDLWAPAPDAHRDASLVVSNPPFHAVGSVRSSPDALRARAHGLATGGHGDWLRACLGHARPHARIVLIHRPEALPALLAAAEGRLGALRILPVLPREGRDAVRILFGGVVGSRAAFGIMAPLVLHGPTGAFTARVEAVHRGEETLRFLGPGRTRKSRPQGPALCELFPPGQQTRTRCGP